MSVNFDDKTIPCERIFSNGTEFEWFLEQNCERCKRFRNGKCKVYNLCWDARFDKTKFPYEYLLDFASGLGGKVCKLFTDKPIKRKPKYKQVPGQMVFAMEDEKQ